MKSHTVRLAALLAIAASATALGNRGEAVAATRAAARVAAKAGIDIWDECDRLGAIDPKYLHIDLCCTVEWTEEPAPEGVHFISTVPFRMRDGSLVAVYQAKGHEGVWLERYADAPDYRLLNRGYWRDCEVQEAAEFAHEAWGVA